MTARQVEKRLIRTIARTTDPEQLARLAWHEHCTDAVRLALAQNEHTPADTLETICEDADSDDVVNAAIRHPNHPRPIFLDPRYVPETTRRHDPRRRRNIIRKR